MPLIASGRPWLRFVAALSSAAGALVCGPAYTQALVAVPPLSSPVTDLAGALTPDQSAALDAKLRAFESAQGSQVAVLIVPTTQPEEIEQYAIRVAEAWKIGRGGVDDGAILLVALEDRRVRIEVGYGLEGALPDATANRIIEEDIVPQFRRGDFAGGIATGVDRMLRVIEGEPCPSRKRARRRRACRACSRCCPSCSCSRWLAARRCGACWDESAARSRRAACWVS